MANILGHTRAYIPSEHNTELWLVELSQKAFGYKSPSSQRVLISGSYFRS